MNSIRTSSRIRLECLLLTLSLISGLVFTASCAKKSSAIVYDGQQSFTFEKEMWLDTLSLLRVMYGENFDDTISHSANIVDASNTGSSYVFLWIETSDVYITVMDYDGNAVSSICVPKGLPGEPIKVFSLSDGSMLVLFVEKNASDSSYKYSYVQVDKAGTVLKDQTTLALPEHFQAISWDMDSDKNLYVLGDDNEQKVQSIISLSDSLAIRYEMALKEGTYPRSLAVTAQDDLYLSRYDDHGKIELAKVNKDTGKIGQTLAVQGLTGTDIQLYGVKNGVSGGLVMDTGDKLVNFDPSNRSLAIYVSFELEGIDRRQGFPLLFTSGNTIILSGVVYDTATNTASAPGLVRLVGTKASGEKTTLTVGVMASDSAYMLAKNVYLFNNSQAKYQIEVKDYIDTSAITDAESYQNARKEGKSE